MNDEPNYTGREKRPRINRSEANAIAVQNDPMAYIENMSSGNARKIDSIHQKTTIDLWFDKHYVGRMQFGDDEGARHGIEQDAITELVLASFSHLIFYSTCVEKFSFLNHECEPDNKRNKRVVCQKEVDGIFLNVVIEAHHFGLNWYEITVRTAKKVNGFNISDGQFCLELLDNETSILSKMEKGQLKEIYRN